MQALFSQSVSSKVAFAARVFVFSSSPRNMSPIKKAVILGDGACGKTSLIKAYLNSDFSTNYTPTVFNNFDLEVKHNGKWVNINVSDTGGQEEFDGLRPLCYADVDLFILCFAIDCPDSYDNIEQKWILELQHRCSPEVPMLLVGNKMDIRQTEPDNQDLIPPEAGQQIATEYDIHYYMECSAKTGEGVKEVFEVAAKIMYENKSCEII